jgi:cell division protein FtsW
MRSIRRSIFIVTLILITIGVVVVYSSSAIYAHEKFGDSAFFLKKHLLFLGLGFLLMLYTMSQNIARIENASKALVIGAIVLLGLVLVPGIGVSAGGARRWFRIGALSFQPSEFAKFALIIYLASFLSRKGYKIKNMLYGYLPPAAVVSVMCVMVLLQPDLGTAVACFFISFLIIFMAGGRVRHLTTTALLGVPFLYYLIFSVPYRRKRMFIFLNPWQDSKGAGFQIIQSFLALGSGGLLGVGLGQSKQKLFYLPEAHTDFIFSIIGEELGFLGASAVLILFGVLIWQCMRACFKEARPFNKILIFGVAGMIGFEALVNMGVSAGIFPTKGLPLPFISYGGTSLVVHMAAIGLVLNAMRER